MTRFSATPLEMVTSLWRNRELIRAATRREVLARYRGSALGLLWSFCTPLLMLTVYTFVFGEIFKARWSPDSTSRSEFALVLFVGLIVFNVFSECINRAPTAIIANPNYVKKILFPLEILPFVSLCSAMYHAMVSVGVWLLVYGLLFGAPHVTVLYLPLILGPLCLFILGLSWALASLGVFLRDVSQFIGSFTMAVMFLSPVFYPSSVLPAGWRLALQLNPLTPVIEQAREVLYWGRSPDSQVIVLAWLSTSVVAWLGFAMFQKSRKGFADVL